MNENTTTLIAFILTATLFALAWMGFGNYKLLPSALIIGVIGILFGLKHLPSYEQGYNSKEVNDD